VICNVSFIWEGVWDWELNKLWFTTAMLIFNNLKFYKLMGYLVKIIYYKNIWHKNHKLQIQIKSFLIAKGGKLGIKEKTCLKQNQTIKRVV